MGTLDVNGRPAPGEDYLEWTDLLESVEAARKIFIMMELGAGYGRWSVRAAFLCKQFDNIPCKLVALEAEPIHFQWLQTHFQDNGIDPKEYDLIQAAVSDHDGGSWFNAEGNPDSWYGQKLFSNREAAWQFKERLKKKVGAIYGAKRTSPEILQMIRVPTVSLKTLLKSLKRVDLLDIDVQGAEYNVLISAKKAVNAKVARVHVGTHSPDIEKNLRSLFQDLGWTNKFDFSQNSEVETKWGHMKFGDGVQSWINCNA